MSSFVVGRDCPIPKTEEELKAILDAIQKRTDLPEPPVPRVSSLNQFNLLPLQLSRSQLTVQTPL